MVKITPCGAFAAVAIVCLACGTSARGQQSPVKEQKSPRPPAGEQKSPPAQPQKPEKPAGPSLQELLTQALKENPDVRVAEIKLREAEADLSRTRLQVIRKVVALHQALKSQQAQIETAEASYKHAEAIVKGVNEWFKTGRVTKPELDEKKANLEAAKAALVAAKAALAQTEAELPYVLGKYPQAATSDQKAEQARLLYLQAISLAEKQLNDWAKSEALKGREPASQPPEAMAEKIRKALNTPIKFEFDNVPLSNVVDYLTDKTGVFFHIKGVDLANEGVTLRLKEAVPLAAALQAIGDLLPKARFVVRDYGILVADPATLPPGAILVENFWKTPPAQAAPAPGAEPSRKKLPPEGLNGTIQEVDPKSGLVVLSIGSDAGLPERAVLEVYRLRPKPAYVGRVSVENVMPTRAVARPVAPLQSSAIQLGDQVSTKIGKGP
jgi:hypothetical protein